MRRSQKAVILALLVAYASFYLCRANVDAALPFLIREGYEKTRLGLLSSIATFTYAIGKIVLGTAGDSLGGRRLMLLAVTGSVACSLAFGVSHGFWVLVVCAAANRFFQSGGWPGVVHVVSQRFDPARHGRIMGVLSTSYELGNVCALTLSGFIARWGWRTLFFVNPALLALIGGSAVLSIRDPPAIQGDETAAQAPPAPRASRAIATLARSGAFWTAIALSTLLTFIRIGFLTWTPTYLAEVSRATGQAEISAAIVKSALFPAAGVIATLSVGALSDHFGPGRRAPVMVVSLALLVVLVLTLAHAGVHEQTQAALLIGAIGLCLLGPYSLLAGSIALDIGGKHASATAAGMIDGAGYLGATAAPYVLGRLADRAGWSTAFDVVAAAALLATLVSGAWMIDVLKRRAGS
jgi:sugar phosphate permease